MLRLQFLGTALEIPYDPALRTAIATPLGNDAISAIWTVYSTANFPALLERLQQVRNELQLNDWGYYLLLHDSAGKIQTTANDRELFTWFLLCKSGYLCKIGFSGEQVYLLAPANPVVYEVPYFNFDGVRYFNLSILSGAAAPGKIYTYGETYPGADRQMALKLSAQPVTASEPYERQLRFSYSGRDYTLLIKSNRQTVRFLDRYPQTDFPIFFDATVNIDTENALIEALRPLVSGKSETEAVNLLLRFSQTAFAYKTDDDQFGKEKYLFVEETLFFPYSDCEDRSIFFSYLVRKLTGLQVVGLHFPGHVATAVRFSVEVPGDTIMIDGQRFTVCDPTYINANIGTAMPQFKQIKPEIISIAL